MKWCLKRVCTRSDSFVTPKLPWYSDFLSNIPLFQKVLQLRYKVSQCSILSKIICLPFWSHTTLNQCSLIHIQWMGLMVNLNCQIGWVEKSQIDFKAPSWGFLWWHFLLINCFLHDTLLRNGKRRSYCWARGSMLLECVLASSSCPRTFPLFTSCLTRHIQSSPRCSHYPEAWHLWNHKAK